MQSIKPTELEVLEAKNLIELCNPDEEAYAEWRQDYEQKRSKLIQANSSLDKRDTEEVSNTVTEPLGTN